MKAVVLLFAVLAAAVFAELPNDWEDVGETTTPVYDCDEKNDGLYPDPDDCHNFFECSNGRSLFFRCPDGLAFNDAGHACDFEANVPSCGN